jgi:hypothetical protein
LNTKAVSLLLKQAAYTTIAIVHRVDIQEPGGFLYKKEAYTLNPSVGEYLNADIFVSLLSRV